MTSPKPMLLGDTHLGREFKHNVPLARRGERERLVLQQFKAELTTAAIERVPVHIHMGDLFDKPQVSYAALVHAACIYRDAASNSPGTTFYILQGNHDDSRDLAEVTAWDVFQGLIVTSPNIRCVTEPLLCERFALIPWHPTRTALEAVEMIARGIELTGMRPKAAYGHWDVDPRSHPHNLIPTKELAALGITHAYTGHVHRPDSFTRDGVAVTVVGSMQPYAHGEDAGQGWVRYLTLTLEQFRSVEALTEICPDRHKDDCLRIRLAPGEEAPDPIDCLQWQVECGEAAAEDGIIEVSMEGFDTSIAYSRVLDEFEICPSVRERVDARWRQAFTSGA